MCVRALHIVGFKYKMYMDMSHAYDLVVCQNAVMNIAYDAVYFNPCKIILISSQEDRRAFLLPKNESIFSLKTSGDRLPWNLNGREI